MGKRKGDDPEVAEVSAVTTTSASSNTVSSSMHGADVDQPTSWLNSSSAGRKLSLVRQTMKLDSRTNGDDDDFLKEVQNCSEKLVAFETQKKGLIHQSTMVKAKLASNIETEQAKCQSESENISAMETTLSQMVAERNSLVQDMEELDQLSMDLQKRISQAIEDASQEVEAIDTVEEHRKNQVPKLKHQISLYASTTGIKWDFDNDHLLEGHVSIPSSEEVRTFSIDPADHSKFEIANKVWNIMDPDENA